MSRRCVLLVSLLTLVLCSCPAGGFFGRYLVVNNTEETIKELKIKTRGFEATFPMLKQGEASLHRPASFHMDLEVSWQGESGEQHQVAFSFKKTAGHRNTDDLYVELRPRGVLAWRLVKRPEQVEILQQPASTAN